MQQNLGKWEAIVTHQLARFSGGMHDTQEDAAREYDRLLMRLKGVDVSTALNFPEEREATRVRVEMELRAADEAGALLPFFL